MAIKTENVIIRGVSFVHTYSDAGYKIKQAETGYLYEDAYDPINSGRTYTESDELITSEPLSAKIDAAEITALKKEIEKLKAEQTTQNEAIEASADGLTDLISQVMGGES